jgi:type II secretory pathway component PulK
LIAETLTAPENNVNEEWLNAQREVLEARETVKVQLRGPQANLSLTH